MSPKDPLMNESVRNETGLLLLSVISKGRKNDIQKKLINAVC